MKMQTIRQPGRATLLRGLGTLFALGLLIYLLTQQGWDEVWSALQEIPTWRFAAAILLTLISRVAVSARWYVLLRSAGLRVSLWQIIRITFAGLFASNFLPTTVGGDVVRLVGGIQQKWDAAVVTASLMVDRAVGMAGMALAVPLGLQPLLLWFQQPQAAGTQTLLFAASPTLRLPSAWQGRLKGLVKRFFSALGMWLKQPRALVEALLFTGVHMLCLFGTITLLLEGMGEAIPLWLVGGLWSFVYFVTLLPISINGLGVQEVAMSVIFTQAGGVSPAASLTVALLVRTLLMLASLPGFAFVPEILSAGDQHPAEELAKYHQ